MVTAPDIPGHRVGGVLGTGGFATVYRCWQLAVGREVAVKIDNRVLFTERDRRRFVREVTAAGRLSGHPHVIVFRQSVADYVEHFHSTASLARELMTAEEAAAFGHAVENLVRPHAVDDVLDLPVAAELAWGRITVTAGM